MLIRRFKRFWGMIPLILPFLLIYVNLAQAEGGFWGSLSVRDSYLGEKLDFEVKVGGSSYNTSWMAGLERENDEYFKLSDAQYLYEGFQWQWFQKEAYQINFTEARWVTENKLLKCGQFVYGGSLRNDMTINETVYLGYVKYKWDKLSIEYYYNGVDYYSVDMSYKKYIAKGVYFKATYKDVNGNLFRQAKITYEYHFKK